VADTSGGNDAKNGLISGSASLLNRVSIRDSTPSGGPTHVLLLKRIGEDVIDDMVEALKTI